MIGQKAIGELPKGIGVEERRPYRTEFGRREDTLVDQRLLHHADREPAHVDEAVTDRNGEHHADSVAPEEPVDLRLLLDPRGLGAGSE